VTAVACCPGGRRAATAGMDGRALLWDLQARQVVHELGGPAGFAAPAVAFSPDGELLACGFRDWTIRVYETDSGRPLRPTGAAMRLATRFTAEEAGAAGALVRRPGISLAFSRS